MGTKLVENSQKLAHKKFQNEPKINKKKTNKKLTGNGSKFIRKIGQKTAKKLVKNGWNKFAQFLENQSDIIN